MRSPLSMLMLPFIAQPVIPVAETNERTSRIDTPLPAIPAHPAKPMAPATAICSGNDMLIYANLPLLEVQLTTGSTSGF